MGRLIATLVPVRNSVPYPGQDDGLTANDEFVSPIECDEPPGRLRGDAFEFVLVPQV